MDTLDQLLTNISEFYKKIDEHPETKKRNDLFALASNETYFAKEYPAAAHAISLIEMQHRGKIVKEIIGDITLYKTNKKKMIISLFFVFSTMLLLYVSFYLFLIAAMICICFLVSSIYKMHIYKIQKDCFLSIYENSIIGTSENGVVEIGYSDIVHISGSFDPLTSYETPLETCIHTSNKVIIFPYISHHTAETAIKEQRAMGIIKRKVFWSSLKTKYIETFPHMCNI